MSNFLGGGQNRCLKKLKIEKPATSGKFLCARRACKNEPEITLFFMLLSPAPVSYNIFHSVSSSPGIDETFPGYNTGTSFSSRFGVLNRSQRFLNKNNDTLMSTITVR